MATFVGRSFLNSAHSLDVHNITFLVDAHVCGHRNNSMFSKRPGEHIPTPPWRDQRRWRGKTAHPPGSLGEKSLAVAGTPQALKPRTPWLSVGVPLTLLAQMKSWAYSRPSSSLPLGKSSLCPSQQESFLALCCPKPRAS